MTTQPTLRLTTVRCSTCETTFTTRSTRDSISVDVCSNCHPAYTGEARAPRQVERIERFERRRAQMPVKTGQPWSEEEDRKLLAAFDAGRALQELASAHERTMGAVRARLLKYGRINA